jgi:predicted esterase
MQILAALVLAAASLQENVPTRVDPSQTYTLVLPTSYDKTQKHPLLLVLDPRGRGTIAAKIFAEAADEHGWIVVSSNGTRSDEGPEPNERALRALLPEVVRIYAVDPDRVYAAGFSGTAIVAWNLGLRTKAMAGVIGVGGRLVAEVPPGSFNFAHYGFAGEDDFNNREMRAVDELLTVPHRFESFPGGHGWITPELAGDALAWLEVLAMKENRRARDDAFVDRVYQRDLAAAAALPPRESLRRYQAIVRTYDGLRAIDDARAAVSRLEADAVVRKELQAEKKWDAFEENYIRTTFLNLAPIFAPIREAATPVIKQHVLREFRVADMQRRARREGAEGRAARRILATVRSQLAFYLPRELEQRGEKRLAAALREAAATIELTSP